MAAPLSFLLPCSSSLSFPKPNPKSHLSFLSSSPNRLPFLSFPPRKTLTLPPIRMGGGPRTFPGGVSKWQWKRMQSKKAKQLLKARLLRERQIYEMRKRAELKAAVSELEKPWEMVERVAPNLFSVGADEQVKALADRFQRPGGFDMWSDRDGPEMFRRADNGLPSARFFPKGVVHSVKPYGLVGDGGGSGSSDDAPQVFDDWIARGGGGVSRRRRRSSGPRSISPSADAVDVEVLDGSEVEDVECKGVVRRNANGNGRYGSANKGRKNENIVLRPTTNLYHEGGRNQRMGVSASQYGSMRNHQGDRRLRGHSHSADPLDVELMDRSGEGQGGNLDHREGVTSNSYEKGHSKAVDRRKYGLINRWQRVERNDRVTLRPTSDLYKEGDNKQMCDSRWNMEGNGVRKNNRTSK